MTLQTSQGDAVAPIVALIVVMAAIAALSARFGASFLIAIVCALIAVVGTWRLLAPTVDLTGAETEGTLQADVDKIALATAAPPQAVAAGAIAAVGSVGVVGSVRELAKSETVTALDPDTASPAADSLDDIGWLPEDKPDSLGGAERLPEGAQALAIAPPEQWPAAISSAYSLGRFDVRAASRIGTDHALLDEDPQDDYVVARAGGNKYLIVVLANGVRTAEHARLGSHWAARLLARNIELHLRDGIPGIEKMLDRTRTDLRVAFDEHFENDGTKLRTIATRLVGLIAPVDGGPAAGFRVGDAELFIEGPLGWSSVFGEPPPAEANMVFPRVSAAEVVSIDCSQGTVVLASDGVHRPLVSNQEVAASFSATCRTVVSEETFDQLLKFDDESARDDRTAVAVWFRAS